MNKANKAPPKPFLFKRPDLKNFALIKTPCLNHDDKNSVNTMTSLNHNLIDKNSMFKSQ